MLSLQNILRQVFEKDLPILSLEDFGIQTSMMIGDGDDSRVYRQYGKGANYIFKEYVYSRLDHQTLKLYQELTNKSESLVKDRKVLLDNPRMEFEFEVVPIDIIGMLKKYQPITCSVSKYIDGPNLREIFKFNENYETSVLIPDTHHYSQLKNSPWLNIFTKNNKKQTIGNLDDLSIHLNNALNVNGIEIVSVNVKPQKTNERNLFVITDLCARIKSLAPRPKAKFYKI